MGFWTGFIVGTILSHEPENEPAKTAEELAKEAKARDHKRAKQRLSRDLSHLPSAVEGVVTGIVPGRDFGLAGDVRIVSFGQYKVSVPADAKIVIGKKIRVVGRKFLHDNVWTNVSPRLTTTRQTLNFLATVTVFAVLGLLMWGVMELSGLAVPAPPAWFSFKDLAWNHMIGLFGLWILISGVVSIACTAGLPSLWKADDQQ